MSYSRTRGHFHTSIDLQPITILVAAPPFCVGPDRSRNRMGPQTLRRGSTA